MAKLNRRSISRRTVEALRVEKDTVFWDRDQPVFGIRVYASGTKMYVVQSRYKGRSVRVTVGRHGVITADEARSRASRIVNRIKAGEAPVPEPLPERCGGGPTVADLAARYLEQHVAVHCKESTAEGIRNLIGNHILPEFGKLPLMAVEREGVAAFHARLNRIDRRVAWDCAWQSVRQSPNSLIGAGTLNGGRPVTPEPREFSNWADISTGVRHYASTWSKPYEEQGHMASNTSGLRDNHSRGSVADFLKEKIHPDSKLSIVSAYFTIYAYEALRKQLDTIEQLDFLFGEPKFITRLDPDRVDSKSFEIRDDGLELANQLEQKRVARECARWIQEKVNIRSIRQANLLHGKMYHVANGGVEDAILGSSNFTVRGLGLGNGTRVC